MVSLFTIMTAVDIECLRCGKSSHRDGIFNTALKESSEEFQS